MTNRDSSSPSPAQQLQLFFISTSDTPTQAAPDLSPANTITTTDTHHVGLHGSKFIECLHECSISHQSLRSFSHRSPLAKQTSSLPNSTTKPQGSPIGNQSGLEKFVRRLSRKQSTSPCTSSIANLTTPLSPVRLSMKTLLELKRPSLGHSQGSGLGSGPGSPRLSNISLLHRSRSTPKPAHETAIPSPNEAMDPTPTFSSPTASPAAHHLVLSAPATKLNFSPPPVIHNDEQPLRRRTTSPVQKTPYPSISSRPSITERKPSLSHLLKLYNPPPPVFEVLNRGQFRRKSMNTTRSGSVGSEKIEQVHIKHEDEDEDGRSSSSGPTGSIYSSEVETGCSWKDGRA